MTIKNIGKVIIAGCIFLSFHFAVAQDFLTPLAQPDGGQVSHYAKNSLGELYATTQGGLYVYNGSNWIKNSNLSSNDYGIIAFNNSNDIFLSNYSGIYRSTDGGSTFSFIYYDGVNYPQTTSMYISPVTGYIYIGTRYYGIYRSTDNGDNWTQLTDVYGLTNYYNVKFTNIVEYGGELMASAYDYTGNYNGFYYSFDNGNSWNPVSFLSGLPNSGINTMDGYFDGFTYYLFAGTNGYGVYYSPDLGLDWYQINGSFTFLPDYFINNLKVNSFGYVYATTSSAMYYSTDFGNNWFASSSGITGNNVVDPLFIDSGNNIFVSNGDGPFESVDNGSSFFPIRQGLKTFTAENMAISSNGSIFVPISQGSLLRSDDNGSSWNYRNPSMYGTRFVSIYDGDNSVFSLDNYSYLYRSFDNGDSWSFISSVPTYPYGMRAMDYFGSPELLVGGYNSIWTSIDGGSTWSQTYDHNLCSCSYGYVYDFNYDAASGYLYASIYGPNGGVLVSADKGLSWTLHNNISGSGLPSPIYSYRISTSSSGKVFLITQGQGVYESSDYGTTWTIDPAFTFGYFYAIKSSAVGSVFISDGNYLFRTTDNGTSWDKLTNNAFRIIDNIDISPSNDLYAISDYEGLYKSTNPISQGYLSDFTGIDDYIVYVPFKNSSVSWGDYNNDGKQDFAVAGNDTSGLDHVKMFWNYNNSRFWEDYSNFIPGVDSAKIRYMDFNNDGYLDLLLTGYDNSIPGPVFRLYQNELYLSNGFQEVTPGLVNLDFSSFDFGDINRDGWNDIVQVGYDPLGLKPVTIAYINNRDNTFTAHYDMPGLYNGTVSITDIDKNGRNEIYITGSNGSNINSYIYYYESGIFKLATQSVLPALTKSRADWGDFDQDGNPDLAIIGYDLSGYHCYIYRQTGNYNFSLYWDLSAPAVNNSSTGSVQWGDFDLDGDLDLLTSSNFGTFIFENNAGNFSNILATLPATSGGDARFGDMDFDGDLDILTSSNVYKNLAVKTNTPPDPPSFTNINHIQGKGYAVNLNWNAGSDNETASNGLSYNVEVFRSDFYSDLVIDPSIGEFYNVFAGEKISTLKGNVAGTSLTLNIDDDVNVFSPGYTYYYRVQTVDASFKTSAWTPLDTFNILFQPPHAPSNLQSKLTSYTSIVLTWNDNASDELLFSLERAGDGSGFSEIASLGPNETTYADEVGNMNSTYYYRIRAYNAAGFSSYSDLISVQTLSGNIGDPNGWAFAASVNGNGETIVKDLDFAFNNNIYLTGSYIGPIKANNNVVTMFPIDATADSTVTIIFDATKGDAGLINATNVIMFMGAITTGQYDIQPWNYVFPLAWPDAVNDPAAAMTKIPGTDNKWTITLPSIRSYLGILVDTPVYRLAILFHSVDGNNAGRGTPNQYFDQGNVAANGDIYINLNQSAPAAYPDNNYYFADFSRGGKLNSIAEIHDHPNQERGLQTVIDTVNNRQYLLMSYTDTVNIFNTPVIPQTVGTPEFLIMAFPNYFGIDPYWLKVISSTGYFDNVFMENDQDGNIILTGNMKNGFLYDGSHSFSAFDVNNSFYLKIDKDGNFINGNTFFYTPNSGSISGMTVDEAGNTYVSGFFIGSATIWGSFYSNPIDAINGNTLFLAKIRADGFLDWVTFSDETGSLSRPAGIAVSTNPADPGRGIFVVGSFTDTLRYGSLGIQSGGATDGYLVKFDMNGNPVWLNAIGNKDPVNGDRTIDVVVDPEEGSAYVTGFFTGSLNFPDRQLTGFGGTDIFVAKYWGGGGDFVWAEKAGGPNNEAGNNLRLDQDKNLYVTGHYHGGSPAFGNLVIDNYSNDGLRDVFLAKLNNTSNYALPDMEVKVISVVPSVVDTLDPSVTINYVVYNHGDIASPSDVVRVIESFDNSYDLTVNDNRNLGDFPLAVINPGDSATYNQILTFSPAWGSTWPAMPYIFLDVNPSKSYPEVSYQNNVSHTTLTTDSYTRDVYELEDSYVDESQPDTNFGADTVLVISNNPGATKMGLVKFDISSESQLPNYSNFVIQGNTDPSNSFQTTNFELEIWGAQPSSWAERPPDSLAVTWNNKPLIGNKLLTFNILNNSSTQYYPASDTLMDYISQAILNHDSILTFYLVAKNSSGTDNVRIESREKVSWPTMDIHLDFTPADLLPTASVSVTPSTEQLGKPVLLDAQFINNSNAPISQPVRLGVYFSTDTIYGNGDDIPLYSVNTSFWWAHDFAALSTTYTFDNSFPLGNNYILYVADVDNVVIETDKANNYTFSPLTLLPASLADYLPVNPSLLPNPARLTEQVELKISVKNKGGYVPVVPSEVAVYLSIDSVLDGSDSLLYSISVGGVDTLVNTDLTNSYTFSEPVPGDYYIIYSVDNANDISEFDESNNTLAVPFHIDIAPGPDYVITNQDASPTVLTPSDLMSLYTFARNNGLTGGIVNSSTVILFSQDTIYEPGTDIELSVNTTGPLSPGNFQTFNPVNISLPGGTLPDSYYLLFVADAYNEIQEMDETNNLKYIQINVVAQTPDLILSNSSLNPPNTISIGETLNFHTELFDNNITGISNLIDIGIYTDTDGTYGNGDDRLIGIMQRSISNNVLDTTFVYDNTFIPGPWNIYFVADPANTVLELNEGNNLTAFPITLLPEKFADYTPVNPVATNNPSRLTQQVALEVSVSNIGHHVPTQNSTVATYLSTDPTLDGSDSLLTKVLISGVDTLVNSVATGYYTFNSPYAPGNYYLIFEVDQNSDIVESDEFNNTISIPFQLDPAPAPDYIITNQVASPSVLTQADPLTVGSYITNSGLLDAGVITSTLVVLSPDTIYDAGTDTLLYTYPTAALAIAGLDLFSTNVSLPASIPAGQHYILFVADGYNGITELDETNNIKFVSINVAAQLPDLYLNSGLTPSDSVSIGQGLLLHTVLSDNNFTSITNSIDIKIIADQNNFIGDGDDHLIGIFQRSLSNNSLDTTFIFDNSFITGTWFLHFIADPANNITETNESNNNQVLSVYLKSAPLPDLAFDSTPVAPPLANIGTPVSFQITIINSGDLDLSSSSSTNVYLSSDNVLDVSDTYLTGVVSSALTMGQTESYNPPFMFDNSFVPGSYFLIFALDAQSIITEKFENNNLAVLNFILNPTPAPDYTVLNPSASPAVLAAGDSITIGATVYNQGLLDAATTSLMRFYLSADTTFSGGTDIFLYQVSVNAITSGATQVISTRAKIPANTPVGNYFILSIADFINDIPESYENNNVNYFPVQVLPVTPDLFIVSASVTNPQDRGIPVLLYGEIYDHNGTGITNTFDVGVYLSTDNVYGNGDDILLTSFTKSLLDYKINYEPFTFDFSYLPGDYYLFYVVDPSHAIADPNRNDNIASLLFTLNAGVAPDYTLSNATFSPASPIAITNTSVQFDVRVTNSGSADAALTSTLNIYLSTDQVLDVNDILLANPLTNSLVINGFQDISFPGFVFDNTFTAGPYYILYVADAQGNIIESDESNNVIALAITLAPPYMADITLNTPGISPSSTVQINTQCNLSVFAVNSGQLDMTTSSAMNYYLSIDTVFDGLDLSLTSTSFNKLNASQQQNVTLTNFTFNNLYTPGSYYILFIADMNNNIPESNDNNNLAYTPITLTPAPSPDLVIQNPFVSPSTLKPLDSFNASCDIRNIGTQNMSSSSIIRIYLSALDTIYNSGVDVQLDFSSVPGINQGASRSYNNNINLPFGTANGNYYILFIADADNTVAELNENNNLGHFAIVVSSLTDAIAPSIATPPTFPASINSGSGPAAISTSVTDNVNVQSVKIKYKGSATAPDAWKSSLMSLTTGSIFSVSIPENEYDVHGLMFYIVANDPSNNIDSTIVFYSKIVINTPSQSVNITQGSTVSAYKIVSIPYVLSNSQVSSVFSDFGNYDDTKWRLFSYNSSNQAYNELSSGGNNISRGQGYFLISKDRSSFNVQNGTNPSETPGNPFTINLKAGWNLIGDPYLYNLFWSDIMAANGDPAALFNKNLRTNSGENFVDTDRLREFSGAFINALNDITIDIPVYHNPGARLSGEEIEIPVKYLKNSIDNTDWEVAFRITSGDKIQPFGGLGMRSDASDLEDIYDDFTMPRFQNYLELNHKDKKFAGSTYTRDIISSRNENSWNFTIENSKPGEMVNVTWDNSYFGHKKRLLMADIDNQVYIDMVVSNTYSFRSNGVNNFRVLYSSPETGSSTQMLSPAYPNPFTDLTRFGLFLPENQSSQVQINIFNSVGSQVNQLFDGTLPGGFYDLTWNGMNIAGHPVNSGVYIITVKVKTAEHISNLSLRVVKK